MDGGITLRELANRSVTDLNGVGEVKAKALADVGVGSILDLLGFYPRRYLDRSREATVAQLEPGSEGMVLVRIDRVVARRTRKGRSLVEVRASDETGRLRLTFFNQPWRERQLQEGMQAVVFGKADDYQGTLQMVGPVVDLIGDRTGRIVAVYPQSETAGLHSWDVDSFVGEALRRTMAVRGLSDPVPRRVRDSFRFMDRSDAYRAIHRPESMAEMAEARRRLVFDELLRIQMALVRRKLELERTSVGIAHPAGPVDGGTDVVAEFHDRLGFELTGAQHRTIDEIAGDLSRPVPMHRLLQGDVGSGKTVVAVTALLTAVRGGRQGAFMAPTEVLAEQHHLGVAELLDGMTVPDPATLLGHRPLKVDLLTNRTTAAERRRIASQLVAGGVDVLIGTHALIQEGVEFGSLGVVVIDEQHRFGVEQRAALREKNRDGTAPDVLVMTATPIPRTAAMTVYGDLDVSVLDEMPPGRTPIDTAWVVEEEEVWQAVRDEVAAGRQAYVVCPLIDESDALQVRSAEEAFAELSTEVLSDLRIGLLHGRVTRADKEETMRLFRFGELDVLVATTVIEVGVDVPNATVMVVLDAARFGIAQLHQLRGRVGRGAHISRCFLVGEAPTPDAEERLKAIVRTTDGFELAEVDLDLRGEGTIMGERQKGRNDLRLASLRRDREWVEAAREVALSLVADGSGPEAHPELADEVDLFLGADESAFLLKS
ncbi:MAG: ATP-dependent DNA helicase RecG [Actinomycetia bacterium]|jgi:ATP-dependent DNA helicase RecG|nr:ATP-dependent DNA helicase RecG [Actinomycetes bacterium]